MPVRDYVSYLGRTKADFREIGPKIISHGIFNERSGTVIAVALTRQSRKAGFPLTSEMETANLPKRSWVKISQIRTLSVERNGKLIGKVALEEIEMVIDGLNEIIGA